MKTPLITIIILLALTSSSCKKTYKCSCTTTLAQPGYYPYQTVSIKVIDKKTTKKRATEICENTANQVSANTRLLFDDDVTVSTKCAVQ
jgi:hypothetical protein